MSLSYLIAVASFECKSAFLYHFMNRASSYFKMTFDKQSSGTFFLATAFQQFRNSLATTSFCWLECEDNFSERIATRLLKTPSMLVSCDCHDNKVSIAHYYDWINNPALVLATTQAFSFEFRSRRNETQKSLFSGKNLISSLNKILDHRRICLIKLEIMGKVK